MYTLEKADQEISSIYISSHIPIVNSMVTIRSTDRQFSTTNLGQNRLHNRKKLRKIVYQALALIIRSWNS